MIDLTTFMGLVEDGVKPVVQFTQLGASYTDGILTKNMLGRITNVIMDVPVIR